MSNVIVPVARSLLLCDHHIGAAGAGDDLYGIFTDITPVAYPYVRRQFVVFAQLVSGTGRVPFYVDIRRAEDGRLVFTTPVRELEFHDRLTPAMCIATIQNCRFPKAGVYIIELFCHDTWVSDTTLVLD